MNKLQLAIIVALLAGFFAILVSLPIYLIFAFFLAALALLVYGSASIGSQLFLQAHLSGSVDQRSISLTFDDGPHPVVTPQILEVLDKFGVQATFFIIGKHLHAHPKTARMVFEHGHLLGNHTYSHGPLIDLYPRDKWINECKITDQAIYDLTGNQPNLFRPPYGVTNPAIARMNNKRQYEVIGWSLRSMDTVIHDPGKLFKRLTDKISNGDILLFHDTQLHLAPVLEKFLEYCLQENIQVVPLTKLLSVNAYK